MFVLHRGMDMGHSGMTGMWGHMGMEQGYEHGHRGTHRHETLGYRHSGTVHVSGCTYRGTYRQMDMGTVYAQMWS